MAQDEVRRLVLELVGKVDMYNFDRFTTTTSKMFSRLQENYGRTRKTFKMLGQDSFLGVKQMLPGIRKMNQGFYDVDKHLTKGTKGMRWFKMEMLGVMFFGMALQRTFTGLLQPAAEAFGIMDLWSTMLMLVFLPVMQLLFPIFMSMFNFFTNLPEPVKMVIGVFVALGAALGTIMFMWGQLSIGWMSLMKALTGLGPVIQPIIAFFTGLSLTALAVFAVIAAVIFGFILAWKTNWGGIRDWVKVMWEGIKNIFRGALEVIMGILSFFVDLFTLNWDKLGEDLLVVWQGVKDFFSGFGEFIIGIVATVSLAFDRFFVWIWEKLTALWDWLVGIWEKAKDFVGLGSEESGNLPSKPKSFNDVIWRAGQPPIAISPDDNVIATKGNGSGGISISYTINGGLSGKEEVERMIRNANAKLVNDIQRLVGA